MIKTIITDLEKLSERSDELDCLKDNQLVRETTLNLKHTIQAHNLTYLSGPQIGVNKRILCINFSGDIRTFVNPLVGANKGFVLSREDCASIPGKEFILPRNAEVAVMYQTPTGKVQSNKLKGKAAFVMQAAVQTLDGLYISDVGLPILDGWDDLSDDEKDIIINDYLESLDIKKKEIDTDIKNDEQLSKTMDAINFIESVQSGKTKLESIDVEKENK